MSEDQAEKAKKQDSPSPLGDLVAWAEQLRKLFPKDSATGLDGSVTLEKQIEGTGYYAELLAHEALAQAAANIAERVKERRERIPGMFLVADLDLSSIHTEWQRIGRHLDRLTREAKSMEERLDAVSSREAPAQHEGDQAVESPLAAAAVLPTLLKSANAAASFFRRNLRITGRKLEAASPDALLAPLVSHLEGIPVRIPKLRQAPKFSEIDAVVAAQDGIRTALARCEPRTDHDQALATAASELSTRLQADLETLATGTAASPSPLEKVALIAHAKGAGDWWKLLVGIESQGTELHTTTSMWSQGRVSYVGGAVVVFYLLDANDDIQAAGSVPVIQVDSFKAREGPKTLDHA